ncbi:Ig-like domain-containing protein [uncultured Parabacteroides sp.]|uniref:Ig-like domain-containing protein n=1 Tax=uncultured Parabacteroides sp. TaxID=512312 RepID=UPI002804A162|nr:Ig-like domain-containing protein [uncultured Parabacteroides sp.]
MKNIKSAISLALLAVAPAIYAQNIDTKSAPDVPTFSVTLNVTNNGGGLDSLMTKKAQSESYDSLLFKGGATNKKLVYGTPVQVGMKAEAGKMISSFTVNGSEKTFEAVTQAQDGEVKGTVSFDKKVNNYSIELGALKEKTDIVINWVAKPEVKLVITGTEQTVNSKKEATLTVKADDVELQDLKYYSDAACTKAADATVRKNAGIFYIPIKIDETATTKGVDRVITMTVNEKVTPVVQDAPISSSVLLQGQPLSAAVITGGVVKVGSQTDHVIKGTWSWANPNALVDAGVATAEANKYEAIFTPDSAAVYNTVTTKIGVTAKPVKTVTVNQTAGGVVAIENASADNKYIGSITDGNATDNPKITVTATPDAGYKFDSWAGISGNVSGTEADKETKVTSDEITITADAVVSAKFVKATRTITITAPTDNGNNSLKVLNGTQEVATGTAVPVGTTLTIVATPGDDQEVVKVGYTKISQTNTAAETDPETVANSFIVSGKAGDSYTVAATFKAKPASNFLVSVAEMKNGALKLKKGTDDIAPNSSVEKDSYVSIIPLPNKGYKLKSLLANGTDIKEASGLTVTAETNIVAEFEKESYPVAVTVPTGVSINVKSGNQLFEASLGTVTATETDPNNYRLINLLVNNKPVANGSEVIVNGPTNISAQVKKLAPLSILNEATTTVTYSGKAYEYAVKTTANLGGFDVKYTLNGKDTIPTGAGTYVATITRPADDIYAAFSATRTLVIEKGVPGIKSIPTADKAATTTGTTEGEVAGSATVAGKWMNYNPRATKAANGLRADGDLKTIYFVPTDENLMVVSAVTPADEKTATSLTASVTLPSVTNGSIVLMNGDIAVAAGQSVYKGQVLTIKLIPDAGYKLTGTLTGADKGSTPDMYTFTVKGTNTLTAESLFTQKTALSSSFAANNVTKTYTGSPIELANSDLTYPDGFPKTGWVISYKKGGDDVTPTNVIKGDGYTIFASRAEDANYQAFAAKEVGTLTISPASIQKQHVTTPTATAITKGEMLNASSLTGGSVVVNGNSVPGTFAWTNNEMVPNGAGAYAVTFTPTDLLNYSTSEINAGLTSYVSMKDASSYLMTLKTVNTGVITITDAAGSTIDQDAAKAGTLKVAAGMELRIVAAATGTKIDKIEVDPMRTVTTETTGNNQVWSFVTPDKEDFTVTVTFTKESTSEGGDTPAEGTPVTGISLNKSTLTLPRLKSEKLVATVAPTGATKKDVKWTSTAPAIASVEADGTVKALKVGQATIIATTVDGGFTAMCEVTVDFATALEKILSESHVYGQKGQIVIEPAAPVEATIVDLNGKIVYHSSINNTLRMPVCSGVYIVRLSASGTTTTTKVLVH